MPYFPDLSPHQYQRGVLYVGWLDPDHEYKKGKTSPTFKARLAKLCADPQSPPTSGHHVCLFCGRAAGEGVIRVHSDRVTFAAPVMVTHYVDDHDYHPPEQFIDAVLKTPVSDAPTKHAMLIVYDQPIPEADLEELREFQKRLNRRYVPNPTNDHNCK